MPELEPFAWSPGSVSLKPDKNRPTICCVIDGEGKWCGAFRVGEHTLQYNAKYPEEGGTWKDATPLWARVPPWCRRQVTDALHLHALF